MNRPEQPEAAPLHDQNASITAHMSDAVGVAVASTPPSVFVPVAPESGDLREGTDAATPGSTTSEPVPKRRTDKRARNLAAVADKLSVRDWEILRSVSAHRFLTTAQITRLHFAGHTAASGPALTRRVLGRLRSRRLLATLERRVGGVRAGSTGLVYYVDAVGDRLLRRDANRPSRRRFTEPSPTFLQHTLALAETHLSLVEADRTRQCQLLHLEVEPASWRTHLGLGGAQLVLKPDLYVETAIDTASQFVNSWFLEVDLGTEHLPTLLRKSRDYDAYYRSGTEQTDSGTFPLVVWIMAARDAAVADRRIAALRAAIDNDARLDGSLFRVITPDHLINLIKQGGEL